MIILAIADIHNDVENLLKLLEKLEKEENFDVIVCPGDFTDDFLPKGFSRLEIIEAIVETIKSFSKTFITVPGNQDREIIHYLKEKTFCVHGDGLKFGEVGFFGFGGAKTPVGTSFEPSEEEILEGIKKGYEKVKNCKIKVQITHAPPYLTKLDLTNIGVHAGSLNVKKFLESVQPSFAICAHIHEAKGMDRLGKTYVLNPGRFPEGYCGFIEIDEKMKVRTKVIL